MHCYDDLPLRPVAFVQYSSALTSYADLLRRSLTIALTRVMILTPSVAMILSLILTLTQSLTLTLDPAPGPDPDINPDPDPAPDPDIEPNADDKTPDPHPNRAGQIVDAYAVVRDRQKMVEEELEPDEMRCDEMR